MVLLSAAFCAIGLFASSLTSSSLVAAVVGFLVSSAADFITGQAINVDGGIEFH